MAPTVIVRMAVSRDFVQFDSDCDTPSIHTPGSDGVFNYCGVMGRLSGGRRDRCGIRNGWKMDGATAIHTDQVDGNEYLHCFFTCVTMPRRTNHTVSVCALKHLVKIKFTRSLYRYKYISVYG